MGQMVYGLLQLRQATRGKRIAPPSARALPRAVRGKAAAAGLS